MSMLDWNAYRKQLATTIGEIAKSSPDLVKGYKADIQQIAALNKFQRSYAEKHGQSGFRNLPASNRLEAAIEWLSDHSDYSPQDIEGLKQEASQVQSDAEANALANALFRGTGIGRYKRAWDDAMREARGQSLSRKRQ